MTAAAASGDARAAANWVMGDLVGALKAEGKETTECPVSTERLGKTAVLTFLVGQVMRATRGQANPGAVNQLLREKLG